MSEQPIPKTNDEPEIDPTWEALVTDTARELVYPPTPDIAANLRRRNNPPQTRRLGYGWAAVLALVLIVSGLLVVPEVRAAVLEIIRVGVVTIFRVEPTITPTPAEPTGTTTPTLPSILDLNGATTLDDARERASFEVLLPQYPADLGRPDRVFYEDAGPVVTLVWLEAGSSDVRLSLQMAGRDAAFGKYYPWTEIETRVNKRIAFWLTAPHWLEMLQDGEHNINPFTRSVEGNVLIWEALGVTYRLETDLSLEEAVLMAESLASGTD